MWGSFYKMDTMGTRRSIATPCQVMSMQPFFPIQNRTGTLRVPRVISCACTCSWALKEVLFLMGSVSKGTEELCRLCHLFPITYQGNSPPGRHAKPMRIHGTVAAAQHPRPGPELRSWHFFMLKKYEIPNSKKDPGI